MVVKRTKSSCPPPCPFLRASKQRKHPPEAPWQQPFPSLAERPPAGHSEFSVSPPRKHLQEGLEPRGTEAGLEPLGQHHSPKAETSPPWRVLILPGRGPRRPFRLCVAPLSCLYNNEVRARVGAVLQDSSIACKMWRKVIRFRRLLTATKERSPFSLRTINISGEIYDERAQVRGLALQR